MMRLLLTTTLFFCSLHNLSFAEGKLPLTRSEEPIQIKSDQLHTDNGKKVATFTGNVAARQGDLTIYSDRMVVRYSEDSSDVSSAEVFGNVRILQGDRRAQADHGIYDARNGRIVLDGNPKVYQQNDAISGKVITYYLDKDSSEITSGGGSRVEAVIHPKGKVKTSDGKTPKQ